MAHTLLSENRYDRAFLDTHCVGFDAWAAYLTGATDGQPKDACWAAGITGVAAETIAALARSIANQRSLLTAAWSLQRAQHGEQP
ncbi:hypothetical protein G6F22_021667 [Rhizopus arrhizus]|nr:hypothetical protein G6F22_021667 [Rhizopus arrhizus]